MTLAEILAARGFDTAAVVAAGVLDARYGVAQGFANFDDPPEGQGTPERSAEEITELALATVDGFDGDRYFLWAHYYDPHSPFDPKPPYEAPPETAPESTELYDLEVAYMDHWIGRLLDGLERRGRLDRTAVVVVADHGESLGQHGETYHTLFVYDATQHVPLIVRLPNRKIPTRIDEPVSTIDVFATALELLGVDAPDGTSSRPLPGLGLERDGRIAAVFSESMAPALRFGWAGLQAARDGRWLYIRAPREELYDLVEDPRQEVDLASLRPNELRRARKLLANLLEAMPAELAGAGASVDAEPEALAELEALGYLSASDAASAIETPLEGEDPKDMIEVAEAYQLARFAMRLDRFETAERLLHFVVSVDPANVAGWTDYGDVLLHLDRPGDAREALESAVALRRGGRTLTLLASAERRLGEFEGARRRLEEALSTTGFPGRVWEEIAQLRYETGDIGGTIEAYRRVLEHEPNNATATQALTALETGPAARSQANETTLSDES